jgi:hypothetical protein
MQSALHCRYFKKISAGAFRLAGSPDLLVWAAVSFAYPF